MLGCNFVLGCAQLPVHGKRPTLGTRHFALHLVFGPLFDENTGSTSCHLLFLRGHQIMKSKCPLVIIANYFRWTTRPAGLA